MRHYLAKESHGIDFVAPFLMGMSVQPEEARRSLAPTAHLDGQHGVTVLCP
jgi:hypothetical protein